MRTNRIDRLIVALILLLSTPAGANIIMERSFSFLVTNSPLIVVARLTDTPPQAVEIKDPNTTQMLRFKRYELAVEEPLKGAAPTQLPLVVYDGIKTEDGNLKTVIGSPVPPKESAVYFLSPFDSVPNAYVLTFFNQSIAPVRVRAEDGERIVLVRPLVSTLKRDLTLAEFKKEIQWADTHSQ